MERQHLPESNKFGHFIGENYELSLKQAIENFFSALRKSHVDFTASATTFHGLMLCRIDPPLETIWCFAALKFLDPNLPKLEPWDRFSATKDLLDSITACSASCSSSKCIALIASVIYNVYGVIDELKVKELGVKREKKLRKDIKSLIDRVLGYISVCCNDGSLELGSGSGSDGLIWPLEDLVSVWTGDEIVKRKVNNGSLRLFFPLLSDEIVVRICSEGRSAMELAGVVMVEVFLLRLCLDIKAGIGRPELHNELRNWAVACFTGFQNFHFFDILVMMLLESTMPVTSLLDSEEEFFLRSVLYDAIILVDYSFLYPKKKSHISVHVIESLAVSRLVLIHKVIEQFRDREDHSKALSYTKAFTCSRLPSQLIKQVKSIIGMQDNSRGPKSSSPKAFIKWILHLENQGIKIFGNCLSKFRARLLLDISLEENEQSENKTTEKESDADLFYIDNTGEEEHENEEEEKASESMSATFMAAAQSMKSMETGSRRKRKGLGSVERRKQVKFLNYGLYDDSASLKEAPTLSSKDCSDGDSEEESSLSEDV